MNPRDFLSSKHFVDSDDDAIRARATELAPPGLDERAAARALFYAVRDGYRYDPYSATLDPDRLRASRALREERLFCVPKAIVLVALARARGIPAALGLADVRNHLATRKLLERLGTDLFVFHGYALLWIGGRWVKATPTFNRALSELFGVPPLEFDGKHDALLPAFDGEGRRHMEIVRDRGAHADLPHAEMVAAWREAYPALRSGARVDGDLEAELDEERS